MLTVNRPTALGLSILLHGSLLLAGLITWPFAARREPIHITPITLVTAPQAPPLRAAEEAPEPQAAQVEKPEPAPAKEQPKPKPPEPKPPVPPPPAPKPPEPKPVPPKPLPAPKPVAKAITPAPLPKPAAPSRPVNLNDLARSLAQAAPPAPLPTPVATAPKGPTQAEKDAMARQAEGEAKAATANALQAIGSKIADNWNLSCANPDERKIVVILRIELGINGGLISVKPDKYDRVEEIPDPRLRAAALGAASAAMAAQPFNGLPQQTYADWRSKTYEFRASDVCADRMRGR